MQSASPRWRSSWSVPRAGNRARSRKTRRSNPSRNRPPKQAEPQQAQTQQPPKQPEPQEQRGQQSANESQSTGENLSEGEIRRIQQALEEKGFKVGYIDGMLGPLTERALKEFQKRQGLQQTGMPDQPTLAALGIAGGASTAGQGPAGHRQPTAADAPSQDQYDEQLRRDLNICRGC